MFLQLFRPILAFPLNGSGRKARLRVAVDSQIAAVLADSRRDVIYAELLRIHQRMRELAARNELETLAVMQNHYINQCRTYRDAGGDQHLPDFELNAEEEEIPDLSEILTW